MQYLAGIDEVGRGPLAGPVSIGIAVVPVSFDFSVFPKLNDSKQMTEKARESCAARARELQAEGAFRFGVFSLPSSAIDAEGIEKCISSLIVEGLRELFPDPHVVSGTLSPSSLGRHESKLSRRSSLDVVKIFLDGRLKAPKEYQQETVIGGDAKVPVISLASVVAKVERDTYMTEVLHPQFPEYGFDSHKGYGTAKHISAIREFGPSQVHRKSFLSRILPSVIEPSMMRS